MAGLNETSGSVVGAMLPAPGGYTDQNTSSEKITTIPDQSGPNVNEEEDVDKELEKVTNNMEKDVNSSFNEMEYAFANYINSTSFGVDAYMEAVLSAALRDKLEKKVAEQNRRAVETAQAAYINKELAKAKHTILAVAPDIDKDGSRIKNTYNAYIKFEREWRKAYKNLSASEKADFEESRALIMNYISDETRKLKQKYQSDKTESSNNALMDKALDTYTEDAATAVAIAGIAAMWGSITYSVAKTMHDVKKAKADLKKIEKIYASDDPSFIPFDKMKVGCYKVIEGLGTVSYEPCGPRGAKDVLRQYYYNGDAVFGIRTKLPSDKNNTVYAEFKLLDSKYKKYEKYYQACVGVDGHIDLNGCINWIYIELKRLEKGSAVTEAANIDDDIKPIINKLNAKGYTTKYSSSGHPNLRKTTDRNRDGVKDGKLYTDARIMFTQNYKFPEAPKHWVMREVDGCSYLDVKERNFDYDGDKTPDEMWSEWKKEYMETLATWVDNLDTEADAENGKANKHGKDEAVDTEHVLPGDGDEYADADSDVAKRRRAMTEAASNTSLDISTDEMKIIAKKLADIQKLFIKEYAKIKSETLSNGKPLSAYLKMKTGGTPTKQKLEDPERITVSIDSFIYMDKSACKNLDNVTLEDIRKQLYYLESSRVIKDAFKAMKEPGYGWRTWGSEYDSLSVFYTVRVKKGLFGKNKIVKESSCVDELYNEMCSDFWLYQ